MTSAPASGDHVTSWWRGLSLRAKITGVTVSILAIGLVAAGIGTGVFLRNGQVATIDQSLTQTVTTDIASTVFDVTVVGGEAQFENKADPPLTPYYVAVYAPDDGGTLLAVGGGLGPNRPAFPESFRLADTVIAGTEPFPLESVEGGTRFHAAVDYLEIEGARDYYTQLVALPLSPANQTTASYIGIYTILALLTIAIGALTTRWLVTLAFRSLGQVEQTAMSIAAGDFTQRMDDVSPRTEVGRLKTALNAMLDQIDGAISQRDATVQQMRRFIGDASHELRTPLVTVRGYAELYRMGAIREPDETAQAMERIEKEAKRMGGLVEDLLALARLDERRDIVIGSVDLRPIARDAALDLRATSPQREVTVHDLTGRTPLTAPIRIDEPGERPRRPATSAIERAGATFSRLRRKPRPVDEGDTTARIAAAALGTRTLEPIVLGDENRIRQVVTNLLGNARRYSPADSLIELAVGVDPDAGMGGVAGGRSRERPAPPTPAVVDHGEGIPEQIRAKIFQRFWRADTSRTRETGGSGLGLSIVASIVEALHGSIDVTETPGGGATFRVGFPLAHERAAADHLHIETQPLPRLRDGG